MYLVYHRLCFCFYFAWLSGLVTGLIGKVLFCAETFIFHIGLVLRCAALLI